METTKDVIVRELTDEKNGLTFAREYLKADFLAAAVDALFYARRQAGLTQEQVAQKLGKKQEAIARWEADTEGKMSLRQYVEIALACDMIPLDIILESIDSVRDYVIHNPQAPRTQDLYNAWLQKHSEPTWVSQPPTSHTLTVQAGVYAAQPTNTATSNQEPNQEGKRAVRFVEQFLNEQYQRQCSQALPQWTGEGITVSGFQTMTLDQTREPLPGQQFLIDKVVV